MGYAAGLIGLAAPMAAVAALFRYTGRAERRRRQQFLETARTPPPTPVKIEPTDSFDSWQAGFSNQIEPTKDDKA